MADIAIAEKNNADKNYHRCLRAAAKPLWGACVLRRFKFREAILHIMSIILPTALAAGEMAGASGRDVLAAIVMGVEAAGRLSLAERRHRRGDGFLPSSLAGGFGAVVTAARLLELTPKQCVNAMGINYAQTCGNRQALHGMTLSKRIQPALATRAAIPPNHPQRCASRNAVNARSRVCADAHAAPPFCATPHPDRRLTENAATC